MYLLLAFSIFQHSFSKSPFKLLVCNHANNSQSQSFTTQSNFTPKKIFRKEVFAVKSFYIHVFNWIPPSEKPETQELIARHQAGHVLIRIKCFNIRKLEGRQKGILSMCLCEYAIISICDNLLCIYSVMNN